MTPKLRTSAYAPWAGMFVGALAWFAHHQIGSNADFWSCRAGGPLLTVGLGLVFGLIAAAAGWVSWRTRIAKPANPDRPESRMFAAVVSAGSAALFCFAIILQSLSGLIVPGCLR
jgi:hypothetical protein